jgi:hypothetical protein
MNSAKSVSATFAATSPPTNCDKPRILSHPGWTPDLQQYHYDIFNMFLHFNMQPMTDGSVAYDSIDSAATATSFVQKAHANNDLAILVVGGWGYAPGFNGATTDANRAKFVQQVSQSVRTLGYDGVDIDWEENVNNPNLVQTMKDLRTELNKAPKKLLLIDVCCDVTTSSVVQIAPYVDSIDTMEYETGVQSYFNELVSAGVPASKIINGLGFYAYVNSQSRAQSEVQFVVDNNMKGIEIWDSSEITGPNDARLIPIMNLLGNKPACID